MCLEPGQDRLEDVQIGLTRIQGGGHERALYKAQQKLFEGSYVSPEFPISIRHSTLRDRRHEQLDVGASGGHDPPSTGSLQR